ncbi:uncharacterized protein B0T23DRAFT_441776 [Neurospora hispaniola]|uniref:Uncharacterized protein n=1 Tax=Neurospora hispaniola TaxID=588809 RepID=A0AAJ0I7I4_9PEZI|nr:hypothetical protein B0T23DRAFT_441776 [Neurospora hispaniola]
MAIFSIFSPTTAHCMLKNQQTVMLPSLSPCFHRPMVLSWVFLLRLPMPHRFPFPSAGNLIRVADDSAGHLKPASGRDIDGMSFPSCSFDTLSTVFLALVRTATSITTAKVPTVPSSEALWSEGSKGSSECRQTQACPFAQSSYLEDCRKANHAWVSWTSALYLSILTPSGNIPFAVCPLYLPITIPTTFTSDRSRPSIRLLVITTLLELCG